MSTSWLQLINTGVARATVGRRSLRRLRFPLLLLLGQFVDARYVLLGAPLPLLHLNLDLLVLHALQLGFEVVDLSLEHVNLRLLSTIFRHEVSVLAMHPLSVRQLLFQFFDLVPMLHTLLILDIDDVLLTLVGRDQLVYSFHLLFVRDQLLVHFRLLLLQLEQLHLEAVLVLALTLQLHGLVAESFLEVGQVVHVAGLAADLGVHAAGALATHFLLLLHEHVLLHQGLLKLLPETKALVDVDREFHLDLLGLG